MIAGPEGVVAVEIFGVSVGVPAAVASCWPGIARTDAPVQGVVALTDANEAMAAAARVALKHSQLLCVHAAVVESAAGIFAVPGPSGLGKSTLTAQLLRAGFGYLSDEALVLDRSSQLVESFARPLALSVDSCARLGIAATADSSGETVVPFAHFGRLSQLRAEVSVIVLATRRPGPVHLSAASPAEAMAELTGRSFNHFTDPASTFAVLSAVVRRATLLRAAYGEADEFAGVLAEEFGALAEDGPLGTW